MKINWKIGIAVAVIIGVLAWAVTSSRSMSYSGSNLNFPVKGGPVTVTNSTDTSVAVTLIGDGSRSFSVSGAATNISGSSTRQGTGSTSTQAYPFELVPGVNVFTVTHGIDVNFVGPADTRLQATVEPLAPGDSRVVVIISIVVILGALYYISRTTDHRWIRSMRQKDDSALVAARTAERAAFKQRFDRATSDKPSSGQ